MPTYRVVTKEVCINEYEVGANSKEEAIDSYYEALNTRWTNKTRSTETVVEAVEIFPTDELSK